ncbi:MAG TPA: acyltransferase [Dongiaceae bacterium]|nr:acyltransferase [Dongiaceae bacterium]
MIVKNIRHRFKLTWQLFKLARKYDVLIEKAVTVKYVDTVSFGIHCTLQSGTYVYGSRSGNKVRFGDHVAISSGCVLLGEGGLALDDFTHLGPRVVITTQYGDSRSDLLQPSAVLKYAPVHLGKGCWIGSGSVIMPGSTLGDGCIVAPNSVVFGTWRNGTSLAGNPARPRER